MGIMQFNKQNHERAKDELQHILQLLNDYLRTRTYLVGERITLADIAVACDLLLLFQWIIEPNLRESYPNVTRWFLTLINQKEFQAVLGSDYKLCEKTAQFDAKKFAEVSRQEHPQQSQARAKNHSQSTDEGAKGDKKKAKEEKPAEKPAKKKKKQKSKLMLMRMKPMMFMLMNQNKKIHLLKCQKHHSIWMNLNVSIQMKIQLQKPFHIFGNILIRKIYQYGFVNINFHKI